MSPRRIMITGANGQLGNEFRKVSTQYSEFEFLFVSRTQLDITIRDQIEESIQNFQPDICINCAAYTQVDCAEDEPEPAYLINDKAVGWLAESCARNQTLFIHFSTDYVYNSLRDVPLSESDIKSPKGIYAESKYAGEQRIIEGNSAYLIFRVSWLYSVFGTNFVKTMLRLGQYKEEVTVVNDQIGSPTNARDLAKSVMAICKLWGSNDERFNQVYNYSNLGKTTWMEFAETIFQLTNLPCTVRPISTKKFNARAHRPLWSVLSKDKIQSNFDLQIPNWRQSLGICLEEILAKK